MRPALSWSRLWACAVLWGDSSASRVLLYDTFDVERCLTTQNHLVGTFHGVDWIRKEHFSGRVAQDDIRRTPFFISGANVFMTLSSLVDDVDDLVSDYLDHQSHRIWTPVIIFMGIPEVCVYRNNPYTVEEMKWKNTVAVCSNAEETVGAVINAWLHIRKWYGHRVTTSIFYLRHSRLLWPL
jgi:hypothetical protein